ncbi:MAG: hypothetical protein AAFY59_09150 [Pseudomonadota bacterium]
MEADTQQFFDRFAEKLLFGAPGDLATFYEPRSLYVRPDGSESFVDRTEISALAATHQLHYRGIGAAHVSAEVLEHHGFAATLTLVDVNLQFSTAANTPVEDTVSTFVLRACENAQRIVVHIPRQDCGYQFALHSLALQD